MKKKLKFEREKNCIYYKERIHRIALSSSHTGFMCNIIVFIIIHMNVSVATKLVTCFQYLKNQNYLACKWIQSDGTEN